MENEKEKVECFICKSLGKPPFIMITNEDRDEKISFHQDCFSKVLLNPERYENELYPENLCKSVKLIAEGFKEKLNDWQRMIGLNEDFLNYCKIFLPTKEKGI